MNISKEFFLPVLIGINIAAQVRADNWMGRLPDDAYVAVLSIPGAHDAATGEGWAEGSEELGNQFAKTQDLSIRDQWSVGVRMFDLRPCVYENYMNINHGIVPTSAHFEDVLCLLRDSLIANPSEFVLLHLLHETSGDQVENVYNTRLLEILNRDDLKDYFAVFKNDLKVGDVRGKILLLSRDNYSTNPVGGIFKNWTGEANWSKQTQGVIAGINSITAKLYMQDYSDTHNEGWVDTKIAAINRLLDFSTKHKTSATMASTIRWVINFASAYSQVVSLFGYEISTSDGYRDNATHSHKAILDYLASHDAGPTGIIMMDYAGVDSTGEYEVKGAELVRAIIDNNFKYLQDTSGIIPVTENKETSGIYSVSGMQLDGIKKGINIVRYDDGSVAKLLYK